MPISRSTHSMDSKATLPPKAPAPRVTGTAEGSSSSGAASGLQPRELPLAGYLMARAAMHRKVEDPELKNLRAGHQSVQEVSDLMPLGRANVIQDIEKAKEAHLPQRNMAAMVLEEALKGGNPHGTAVPEYDFYRRVAASSQFAATGVCFSFATSTTPLHAAKLADMKDERAIVAQSKHAKVDHIWSEMMPKGKRADGTPILHGEDVIMDGWCRENMAVLREDSEYARLDKNGRADHLKHSHHLNHQSGPMALKEVEKYKSLIEGSTDLQLTYYRGLNGYLDAGIQPKKSSLWNAETIFHADFRKQAGKALHEDAKKSPPVKGARTRGADPVSVQAKHASLAGIQAVGVARSLGSDFRVAIAEAPEILASAKAMFPLQKSKGKKPLARVSAFFKP